MEIIFAMKALCGVLGVVIGLILGSLIGAIWLRLAAQWLGFAKLPYVTSVKCVLISNLVVFAINFSIGVNHALTVTMLRLTASESPSRIADFSFAYPPIFFLYSTIFGLLVTAAIFCRTMPHKEAGSRVTFVDAVALAALYFALGFACMLLLGLLAFCIVTGLVALAGT